MRLIRSITAVILKLCCNGVKYIDCEETKGRNPHFFKNLFFFGDFGILSHPASTSDFEKIPFLLLSAIRAIINF